MLPTNGVVKVGIADMNIVQAPNSIRTSGLGSCVGVILYEETKNIAGMIHVMLPESSLSRSDELNVAKFADTSIPAMIKILQAEGLSTFRLKAKIAGGAQMFQLTIASDSMKVGPRNVEAVKEALSKHNIPIVAEDTGGNSGRTIEFNPDTKLLNIRTASKGEKNI